MDERMKIHFSAARWRSLLALASSALVAGCALGMGGMMAGGMHAENDAPAPRLEYYAPDRLIAQARPLRLTAEQIVTLQAIGDSVRAGQLTAAAGAGSSHHLLTNDQRRVAEGRDGAGPAPAPAHRHDE